MSNFPVFCSVLHHGTFKLQNNVIRTCALITSYRIYVCSAVLVHIIGITFNKTHFR